MEEYTSRKSILVEFGLKDKTVINSGGSSCFSFRVHVIEVMVCFGMFWHKDWSSSFLVSSCSSYVFINGQQRKAHLDSLQVFRLARRP